MSAPEPGTWASAAFSSDRAHSAASFSGLPQHLGEEPVALLLWRAWLDAKAFSLLRIITICHGLPLTTSGAFSGIQAHAARSFTATDGASRWFAARHRCQSRAAPFPRADSRAAPRRAATFYLALRPSLLRCPPLALLLPCTVRPDKDSLAVLRRTPPPRQRTNPWPLPRRVRCRTPARRLDSQIVVQCAARRRAPCPRIAATPGGGSRVTA